MNSKLLQEIKSELTHLKKYEVIIYGSYASGTATRRSDRDVAIISKLSNPNRNKALFLKVVGRAPKKYDIKIFELLPLDIKASLMQHYTVIYGDPLEISEYFYHFRKLWNDVKQRYFENQFNSIDEKLLALGQT